MSKKSPIPAMPPLSSIEDKNTRMAIQAIVDGLRVRNGEVGTGDERFLTIADLKDGVNQTTINISGGGGVSGMGGLPSGGNAVAGAVGKMIDKLSQEIFNSKLYKNLVMRIALIEKPEWFDKQFGSAIKVEEINRDNAIQAATAIYSTSISQFGESLAIAQEELSTLATATSANASSITTLQTSVGTATTTAQNAFTLAQGANNTMSAAWSVKVDANGYVAGFGLGVDADSGSYSSDFTVLADRFAVITPGNTKVVPFFVSGGKTYINNAVMRNTLLDIGTVTVSISSGNYSQGSAGWSLDATTGSAQFSGLTVTQTLQAYSYNGSSGWSITNAGDCNLYSLVVRASQSIYGSLAVNGGITTGGITLGGVYRSTWPDSGGGSYPTSPSLGSPTFSGTINSTTFNGSYGISLNSNGHAFFGGGVTALGGFANFTGVHFGVTTDHAGWEVGDVLTDVSPFYAAGVSNVTFVVEPCSVANSKRGIGILCGTDTGVEAAGFPETVDATGYDLVRINAVGEGQINVCGEAGNITAGDLLVTSSMAGKAMKQSDDIVRSITVAKCRENVTFASPTEVKRVACVYLCG